MNYLPDIEQAPPSYVEQYTESRSVSGKNIGAIPTFIIKGDNGQYALVRVRDQIQIQTEGVLAAAPLNVSDCVSKSQDVLGLKIHEIAKLAGVSRATLDLHRKGANVKDMSGYERLYNFVSKVENQYGSTIKKGIRNVLVGRKTLVQHLLLHSDDLDATLPLILEVSDKVQHMNVVETNIEQSKLNIRLSHIGNKM